ATGGGAAGGLIAVSNPAAALSTVMGGGAASSALTGITERLIASGGKSAGTLTEVAIDAGVGAGSAGIVKGGASLLRKVLPKKVAPPASKGAVAKAGEAPQSQAIQPYYPSNNGFLGTPERSFLHPGQVMDRYGGSEYSRFFSP